MASYSDKLKDPRWQKKRLEILERDGWSCVYCYDPQSTLHVHHLAYYGDPWDTPSDQLVTACERCHESETASRKKSENSLLLALRMKQLSHHDIDQLAEAVSNMIVPDEPSFVFCYLSWALGDKDALKCIRDHFRKAKSIGNPDEYDF